MFRTAHGTWHRLLLMSLMACALALPRALAQGDADKMAGLLFTCAKYVDWPDKKMQAGAPFVIGVMGSESFTATVQEVNGGRKMKDREVVVKHFSAVEEISGCHVLFVGRSEMARQKAILTQARRHDVLAFGENEEFEKDGGMIFLFSAGGSVKFGVNHRNIQRTDLRISSALLAIAKKNVTDR